MSGGGRIETSIIAPGANGSIGGGGSSGQIAYWSAGATLAGSSGLTFNGSTVGIGGAAASNLGLRISGTITSGNITQSAIYSAVTFPSDATTAGYGINISPSSAASAFTMGLMADVFADSPSQGAGSTITRFVNYYGTQVTGTISNAAFLADNSSFSGYWFLNQSGTTNNLLSGPLAIGIGSTSGNTLLSIRKDQAGITRGSVVNGSVGANASAQLQLTGADDLNIFSDGSGNGSLAGISSSGNHSGFQITQLGAKPIYFKNNGVVALTLDSSQNAIIGGALYVGTGGIQLNYNAVASAVSAITSGVSTGAVLVGGDTSNTSGGTIKLWGHTSSSPDQIDFSTANVLRMSISGAGDVSVKSSVSGLGMVANGAGLINIVDNGTQTYNLGTNANGLLIVVNNSNGVSAIFHVHDWNAPGIAIISDPATAFSVTAGTGSRTNVTNPSQAGTITVENKTGATRSYNVMFYRAA